MQITLFNGHDLTDTASQQVIRSGEQNLLMPFVIQSTSMVRFSPSASHPAVVEWIGLHDRSPSSHLQKRARASSPTLLTNQARRETISLLSISSDA